MITIDCETKSYADLTKVGTWAYSEDPTTDIICVCWGTGDKTIQEWWPGKHRTNEMPLSLALDLAMGHEIEAHHAAFEISIWLNVLEKKYGWHFPDLHKWRDTMAVACYYGLPASLDKLSLVLGFGPKDPEGARLITKYSKLYLKTAKTTIPPEDFRKFVNYCRDDVAREQSVSDYMGDLPKRELPNFLFDLEVNLRGLFLDLGGINNAIEIVEQRAEELTVEFNKLTGLNPTQRDKLMTWFEANGCTLDNLQAEYLEEEVLHGDDPPTGDVRRALDIRLRINKASTKKLAA